MVSKEQVCLTVKNFTGHFGVLIKIDLASRELGVDTDHAIKSQYRIRSQDELL